MGCFVNFGADWHGPGRDPSSGNRGAVVVGELDGRLDRSCRRDASEPLRLFEPDAMVLTPNIWGYLWGKLAYGAMLFATALTADIDRPTCSTPIAYSARRLRQLGQEVCPRGCRPRASTPVAFNGFDPQAFSRGPGAAALDRSLTPWPSSIATRPNPHTGIWRDLAVRKRRTEIDAQLVPILPIAQRHGLELPQLARLVELVHELEQGRGVMGVALLERLAEVRVP